MAQKTVTIRLALEDADKVRRALEDLGEKGKAALDKIDGASTQRLRGEVERLVRSLDPVERSAHALQQRLDLLDRALKQGAISHAEHARAAGLARAQHEALAGSYQQVEQGTRLAAHEITNLSYQIQDAVTQLVGGQSPFLILMQQGPQAAGAVGGVANLMRLLVSPTGLATGGMLAFAGAAALVVSRAVAVNRELRGLEVTLRAYDSRATAAVALRTLARDLYVGGTSREEAYGAVQEIARRRTLSAARGAEIAGLAGNMAAATGQPVAEAAKTLVDALEGGYPAIRALDEAFRLLTAEELRQIRTMAEHGDTARMLDTVLGALHRRFDGLRDRAMGPAERGLHDLGVAWNDLIEAIARSEPVMALVSGLAAGLEGLGAWVRGPEIGERVVAENRRLLDLKRQRDALVAQNDRMAFATFPAELRELDFQITEQERRVEALIAKGRGEAVAAGALGASSANENDDPGAAERAEQERQRKIVDAAVDQHERLARALRGTAVERELSVVRLRAEDEALEKNLSGAERERLIATRLAEAKLQLRVAVEDVNRSVAAEVAGALRVAEAYGVSAEAVRRATLEAKADQEVAKGSIETRDAIVARLRAQDEAQRRLNDAQKIADIQAQVEANLRLAAALRGTVEATVEVERRQRAATDAVRVFTAAARNTGSVSRTAAVSDTVRAWDGAVEPLAARHGVPADVVRRVMQQESGGRTGLVSSAGAIGPMQVMPGTFMEVARRHGITGSITDPQANIEAGVAYLAEQLRTFGSEDLAAAAYNAGPGRVRQHLDHGRLLPAETRAYVAAVTGGQRDGSDLQQAANDADLYARALDRLRAANATVVSGEVGRARSIEDTVRALRDAELRNQAYDLVRRQGLAGQKDENAALEVWLALLKEGERAQAAVAAGRAHLDLRRQRQALEDEITAADMPQAEAELWLAGRQDYGRMVDLGGLQWSEGDRRQRLDEAQRFREREQAFRRERAILADLEAFGERAFDRIGEAMTQMAMEGKDAWKTLGNVGRAILSELSQEVFRFAVMNPLKNLLFGQNNPTMDDLVGTLGGAIAGWFGGGGATAAATSLAGGTAVAMTSPMAAFGIYHAGGMVGADPSSTRWLPAGLLAGAPRYHGGGWAGLAPDEVLAILQRGEAVLSRREVGALRQGQDGRGRDARPVTVVMNIATPDAASFRLSQGQLATDAARAMERARRNL